MPAEDAALIDAPVMGFPNGLALMFCRDSRYSLMSLFTALTIAVRSIP